MFAARFVSNRATDSSSSEKVSSVAVEYLRIPAGGDIAIRRPEPQDRREFVALMRDSVDFHYPWVSAPITPELFDQYLASRRLPTEDGFLIIERRSHDIAGVINLNVITRGPFQSAYLGYYAGAKFAGRGYMRQGLHEVVDIAFSDLGLHRLEANIQPDNEPSLALAARSGFSREGFSEAYLKIYGRWRDHERWAILNPRSAP